MKISNQEGKYIFGVVKVGDKGQIVIPKDARKQYDIHPGDTLMLLGDNNGVAMLKTEHFTGLIGKVVEDLRIGGDHAERVRRHRPVDDIYHTDCSCPTYEPCDL